MEHTLKIEKFSWSSLDQKILKMGVYTGEDGVCVMGHEVNTNNLYVIRADIMPDERKEHPERTYLDEIKEKVPGITDLIIDGYCPKYFGYKQHCHCETDDYSPKECWNRPMEVEK